MRKYLCLFWLLCFSFHSATAQQERSGEFVQNSSVYPISGSVTYVQESNGDAIVTFLDNFATVQGIRLEVFLSADNNYDPAQDLKISTQPLDQGSAMSTPITGKREFQVPSGVDIADYDFVVVQCTQASVLWGYVALGEISGGMSGSSDWTTMEVENGEKASIAIDGNNDIHIAFMFENTARGFVKHSVIQNGSVTTTEVSDAYVYGPLDIAIDQNNSPRIVYHNHDSQDMGHAILAGGSWIEERVAHPGHDGWDSVIDIDGSNNSHLASTDPSQGLEYAYKDANGDWTIEDTGSGPVMYANAVSIKMGSDGTPHIAFYHDSQDELQYATKENGTWVIESIATGGIFPSMVLNDQEEPVIAYLKGNNPTSGRLMMTTRNNGNWTFEDITGLDNIQLPAGTRGARNIIDLELENGTFYAAYADKSKVYYAQRQGTSWSSQEVDEVEGDQEFGQQVSLVFDSASNPHITYHIADDDLAGAGLIMYATSVGQTQPTELSIACAEDITIAAGSSTLPEATGSPTILTNPSASTDETYDDQLTFSDCKSEPDTIFRSWEVTNDMGDKETCVQMILSSYTLIESNQFPSNITETEMCFADFISLRGDASVSGLSNELSASSVDDIVSTDCNEIRVNITWTIKDNCDITVQEHVQILTLQNPKKPEISNIRIEPDDGSSNGSIQFDVSCGYRALDFQWSNNANAQNSLGNLPTGTYTLTLIDELGCSVTQSFTVPSSMTQETMVTSGSFQNSSSVELSDYVITAKDTDTGNALEQCSEAGQSDFTYCNNGESVNSVEVCIEKRNDVPPGVSATDLIRTRNIILDLVDPCVDNLLAADVNQDDRVSASDLVQIRDIILELADQYTSDRSWVFAIDDMVSDCFILSQADAADVNVKAIKLGDLPCADQLKSANPDDIQDAQLLIDNMEISTEEEYIIPVYYDGDPLAAFQFALSNGNFENLSVTGGPNINDDELFINETDDQLNVLWMGKKEREFSEYPMLYLHLTPSRTGSLADLLNLASPFPALVVSDKGRDANLSLGFNSMNDPSGDFILYPNPVSDKLTILSDHELSGSLRILNTSGQLVNTRKISKMEKVVLLMEGMDSGMYIIQYITDDNIVTKSFIIQ